MASGASATRVRYGCALAASLAGVVVVVLLASVGLALHQNRSARSERKVLAPELPPVLAGSVPAGLVRLHLEVHTAGLSIQPTRPGERIRVEADYDPERFELIQRSRPVGEAAEMVVQLRPRGSELMALLRAKLGGRPAMLRILLPRDVPLELEGSLRRSFAAMELGGLRLGRGRFDVEDGGIKVSFTEPLESAMDELEILGNRGSLSVVGLGNANPRRTRLLQHIGALDLDLRGAWRRDAEVHVLGGVAGGSLWLPDNARVRGIEEHRRIGAAEEQGELPLPTVDVAITERVGRLVVME